MQDNIPTDFAEEELGSYEDEFEDTPAPPKGKGKAKASSRPRIESDAEDEFDDDGRADLAVAESNAGKTPNGVDVFLNGANGLQSPIAIPTSDQSQAVELGDVNGDGLPDIVVAGLTSVSVFLNTSK